MLRRVRIVSLPRFGIGCAAITGVRPYIKGSGQSRTLIVMVYHKLRGASGI